MTRRSVAIVLGLVFFVVSILWMARPSVEPIIKESSSEVVRAVKRVPRAAAVRTKATSEEVAEVMTDLSVTPVARRVSQVAVDNVERDLQVVGMSLKGGHKISVR